MFDTLISVKLQNWNGLKAISQHGLVPQSLSFEKYTPGSPELLATILSHKLKKIFLIYGIKLLLVIRVNQEYIFQMIKIGELTHVVKLL